MGSDDWLIRARGLMSQWAPVRQTLAAFLRQAIQKPTLAPEPPANVRPMLSGLETGLAVVLRASGQECGVRDPRTGERLEPTRDQLVRWLLALHALEGRWLDAAFTGKVRGEVDELPEMSPPPAPGVERLLWALDGLRAMWVAMGPWRCRLSVFWGLNSRGGPATPLIQPVWGHTTVIFTQPDDAAVLERLLSQSPRVRQADPTLPSSPLLAWLAGDVEASRALRSALLTAPDRFFGYWEKGRLVPALGGGVQGMPPLEGLELALEEAKVPASVVRAAGLTWVKAHVGELKALYGRFRGSPERFVGLWGPEGVALLTSSPGGRAGGGKETGGASSTGTARRSGAGEKGSESDASGGRAGSGLKKGGAGGLGSQAGRAPGLDSPESQGPLPPTTVARGVNARLKAAPRARVMVRGVGLEVDQDWRAWLEDVRQKPETHPELDREKPSHVGMLELCQAVCSDGVAGPRLLHAVLSMVEEGALDPWMLQLPLGLAPKGVARLWEAYKRLEELLVGNGWEAAFLAGLVRADPQQEKLFGLLLQARDRSGVGTEALIEGLERAPERYAPQLATLLCRSAADLARVILEVGEETVPVALEAFWRAGPVWQGLVNGLREEGALEGRAREALLSRLESYPAFRRDTGLAPEPWVMLPGGSLPVPRGVMPLLERDVTWRPSATDRYVREAEVDGRPWRIRESILAYTFSMEGEVVCDLDVWPERWVKDG